MESAGFHDLVRQAQEGDRGAMDRVLEILQPHLERLARPYADPARPAESTSDLMQESCLRAWLRLGTFQGSDNDEETFAMFRGWIGQIVRRLGVGAQRARNSQRRAPPKKIVSLDAPKGGKTTTSGGALDAPAPGRSPSSYLRFDEATERVREALDQLPGEIEASIVRLYFFDGLNLAQIAERLDLSYDQVRDRYWASMERLERDLKGWL